MMKGPRYFIPKVVLLLMTFSCSKTDRIEQHEFERYIMFNHLYVVVDSATYQMLSNDDEFLSRFSGVAVSKSDTKDESWEGKYLYGKGHYLEIFQPGGYPGAKAGDVGLGFMPTKLGTLDSLYELWKAGTDSVDRKERTIIEDGVTYPWFTALSLMDLDSLQLRVFLMENAREDMEYAGFTEKDLEREISYWEYMRYYRAKSRKTSPDSVEFDKLFEKVIAIHLSVGEKELVLLSKHLTDFDFERKGTMFHGNDINVFVQPLGEDGVTLDEIDFKLTDSIAKAEYHYNKLDVKVDGRKASFLFLR